MTKYSSFRYEVTQNSRTHGQEYSGLMSFTIISLEGLISDKKDEEKFKHLLNDSLVIYQKLMVSEISSFEIYQLKSDIQKYLTLFKK